MPANRPTPAPEAAPLLPTTNTRSRPAEGVLTAEQYQALNGRVTSKYGSRKSQCQHGHTHDSGKEARRCNELHLMEKAQVIRHLCPQPKYPLFVNDVFVCTYRADFFYEEPIRVGLSIDADEGWRRVTEDVKPDAKPGKRPYTTPVYKLKKRLMFACHKIVVKEV